MTVAVFPVVRIVLSVVLGCMLAGLATWWLAPRLGVPEAVEVTPPGAAFAGIFFGVVALFGTWVTLPVVEGAVPDYSLLLAYVVATTLLGGATAVVGWSALSDDDSSADLGHWIRLLVVPRTWCCPSRPSRSGLSCSRCGDARRLGRYLPRLHV